MADALMVFTIAGTIITVGFLANLIFKRTGFPDILFLILTGVIFGPLFKLFSPADLLSVTPIFAALALMLILFQGGLSMEVHEVLSQSLRAATLGFLYVIFATLFVSFFGYLVLGLSWVEALILGPITAGTDSVVIIPLMSRLKVNDGVRVTLSLESTVTDVLNIILVIVFLQIYLSGSINLQGILSSLTAKFAVGIMLGAIVGVFWIKILEVIRRQEYTYMLTIAALILCYSGTEFLGGSGPLSSLVFGIALGNYEGMKALGVRTNASSMPKIIGNVRSFQNEITFLVRAFFFVLLGLIYSPDFLGLIYAIAIVAINLMLRHLAVKISARKSELYSYREFMTLMCGTGLANATLSLIVYTELMIRRSPIASLYPLIATNTIIINNLVTSIVPVILRGKHRGI